MKARLKKLSDSVRNLWSRFDTGGNRFWLWVIPLALIVAVVYVAPHKLGTLTYKYGAVMFAGYLGYRLDRRVFYYGRPDFELDKGLTTAMQLADPNTNVKAYVSIMVVRALYGLRRAAVMGSAMIAAAMLV